MATRKKPAARPAKAAAPKAVKVPPKVTAPALPMAPQASKTAQSEPGKAKDGKEKKGKKKDKKTSDGDNSAAKKKMVRDSFTMPAPDYALIGVLKARTLASGIAVKKSEFLRAGLVALAAMPPGQLNDLISSMPQIKTGRPGKKKK